jgi:hypothetical protein
MEELVQARVGWSRSSYVAHPSYSGALAAPLRVGVYARLKEGRKTAWRTSVEEPGGVELLRLLH